MASITGGDVSSSFKARVAHVVGAVREVLGRGTLFADVALLAGRDAAAWQVTLPWRGLLAADCRIFWWAVPAVQTRFGLGLRGRLVVAIRRRPGGVGRPAPRRG